MWTQLLRDNQILNWLNKINITTVWKLNQFFHKLPIFPAVYFLKLTELRNNTQETQKALFRKEELTDLLFNIFNQYICIYGIAGMLNVTYNHITRSRVGYLNIWAKTKISRVLRPSSVRRLSSRRIECLLNSSPEHPSWNHYWVIVENHGLDKPSLEDSLVSLLD